MIFPLFSLSWTLLVFAAVALGCAMRLTRPSSPPGWHVVVRPADKKVRVVDGRYGWDEESLPLSRSVLVHVESGSQSLTIAAIDIGVEDFEERVGEAQAQAHAKASVLNAYVGGLS